MPPKEALQLLKLSQTDLARHLKVTQSMVSQMLTGTRPWPGRLVLPTCAFLKWRTEPAELREDIYPIAISRQLAEEGRFLLMTLG